MSKIVIEVSEKLLTKLKTAWKKTPLKWSEFLKQILENSGGKENGKIDKKK